MAKSPEVKLAVFGRAGVGKSGKLCVCVCVSITVKFLQWLHSIA